MTNCVRHEVSYGVVSWGLNNLTWRGGLGPVASSLGLMGPMVTRPRLLSTRLVLLSGKGLGLRLELGPVSSLFDAGEPLKDLPSRFSPNSRLLLDIRLGPDLRLRFLG